MRLQKSWKDKMDRISQVFSIAREKGKKVFIPFVTAGFPDLEMTRQLCLTLERAGADIIELGVPFSDPLADGPIIQYASQKALSGGITLKGICDFVKGLRLETQIPIAIMSYYNVILRPGLKESFGWMKEAGIDGLICPDLPPEEGEELIALGEKNLIATIFFLAPTSTPKRIELVSKKSTGFIYYVSVTGVTGVRKELPATITDHLIQIRSMTDKPIAVGFGISVPKQAEQIARWADGVIIGSAIIKMIEANTSETDLMGRVEAFVLQIKHAMG